MKLIAAALLAALSVACIESTEPDISSYEQVGNIVRDVCETICTADEVVCIARCVVDESACADLPADEVFACLVEAQAARP